jgi:hypothetical protein
MIHRFWILHGRRHLRRQHGPTLYSLDTSHNDKDIYSYDSVNTIPFTYQFSYLDSSRRAWTFDLRFLLQLLQYGKELKNPFSQELISDHVLQRLQARAQTLQRQKQPIVYTDDQVLTPEQIWNQKVLDVFLRLTALGYGVNVIWFETMSAAQHYSFYTRLYDMWFSTLRLTRQDRDRIVPGHGAIRTPLFRFNPTTLSEQFHDIRWWRKTNLALMNAFFVRGQDRDTQGCGALYILTALANEDARAAEAFPWLVDGAR